MLVYLRPSIVALVMVVVGLVISQRIHVSMQVLLVQGLPRSLVPNNDAAFTRFRSYLKTPNRNRQLLTLTMSLMAMGISSVGVYCVAIGLGVSVSFCTFLAVTQLQR